MQQDKLNGNTQHYKQQKLVVNARALRAALEQKNGLPTAITYPMKEKKDPVEELF